MRYHLQFVNFWTEYLHWVCVDQHARVTMMCRIFAVIFQPRNNRVTEHISKSIY